MHVLNRYFIESNRFFIFHVEWNMENISAINIIYQMGGQKPPLGRTSRAELFSFFVPVEDHSSSLKACKESQPKLSKQ